MKLALFAAAIAAIVLAAQLGFDSAKPKKPCTHGASSIGPVRIVNGKLQLAGKLRPHTSGCIPR